MVSLTDINLCWYVTSGRLELMTSHLGNCLLSSLATNWSLIKIKLQFLQTYVAATVPPLIRVIKFQGDTQVISSEVVPYLSNFTTSILHSQPINYNLISDIWTLYCPNYSTPPKFLSWTHYLYPIITSNLHSLTSPLLWRAPPPSRV